MFVLWIAIFSSGRKMALEIIPRSCKKMSDFPVEIHGLCWNLHWWVYQPPHHSNGALSGKRYTDEIHIAIVIIYVAPIGNDIMLMETATGHIALIWWMIFFSKKEPQLWYKQRVFQTWICLRYYRSGQVVKHICLFLYLNILK